MAVLVGETHTGIPAALESEEGPRVQVAAVLAFRLGGPAEGG